MGELLVVVFEVVARSSPSWKRPESHLRGKASYCQLEQELKYSQEHLQTTIEGTDVNEELKSSNEELQSTRSAEHKRRNRDMKSCSRLTRLVTVNAGCRKNRRSVAGQHDMKNLFDSTKIATFS
jgi:two-component system CheB/CheR fusion protein